MLSRRVISPNGLTCTEAGFSLDIRLPWYRALPVSCIRIDALSVNGVPIAAVDTVFALGAARIALDRLVDHPDILWFVTNSALLEISGPGLAPGRAYEVAVGMTLFPPYIPGLGWPAPCTRTLIAREPALAG